MAKDALVSSAISHWAPRFVSNGVLLVEDGGHNANNRPYRYRSRSADWLAGQFGLPRI